MKTEIPVIKDFGYKYDKDIDPRNELFGKWYTIAFIYTKIDGKEYSFIVKGNGYEVNKFLEKNWNLPSIIHRVRYLKGKKWSSVSIENINECRGFISENIDRTGRGNKKYKLIVFGEGGEIIQYKELRRIPRKWMKELDQFIQ
jgi:hypothetical protein